MCVCDCAFKYYIRCYINLMYETCPRNYVQLLGFANPNGDVMWYSIQSTSERIDYIIIHFNLLQAYSTLIFLYCKLRVSGFSCILFKIYIKSWIN